jgi:hypothetical protein
MNNPATLQAALSRFLDKRALDSHRYKVCAHLLGCHSAAMGGSLLQCDTCGKKQRWYHGCRDRHCPQCQSRATLRWAERQHEATLPVDYYHMVFTLPHTLNGWVQLHPEVIYRLLFQCTWQTLKRFGEDPKRLGGQLGMSAMLHTWGQTLIQHVHLHCLVPGGVLTDSGHWKAAKGNYLFPVKALSRHFRGAVVSRLRQCIEQGELFRVKKPKEIDRTLDALMKKTWVVYAKPCLNRTASVVDYLSRYTHRIAITNARILNVDDSGVLLRYKDYRDNNRNKTMRLEGKEFVRRYLLHLLPKGFTRIRHYGFLAGCCRKQRLKQLREVLAEVQETPEEAKPNGDRHEIDYHCPVCKAGLLHVIEELPSEWRWNRTKRRRCH